MLTSISPLGERARGNRWTVTVAWLTVGAALGGSALGAVLGLLGGVLGGSPDDSWRLGVLAMGAAAAAVWDLSGRRFPGRRQVNEDWLTSLRPWVYAMGFGAQLGAALATVVNTALVPLFMLAAVLTAQPVEGLLIGGAFGIVRGVSVTMSRRVRTVDDLRDLHRRLDGRADRARRLGVALCAVLAGVSAVSLLA